MKKRWSSLLRRKSGEYDSVQQKDDTSEQGANDNLMPKSPLSKTVPAFPDNATAPSEKLSLRRVNTQTSQETQQTKTDEAPKDAEPVKTSGNVEAASSSNDSSGTTVAEVMFDGEAMQAKEDGSQHGSTPKS